jgi:hypothetical protein
MVVYFIGPVDGGGRKPPTEAPEYRPGWKGRRCSMLDEYLQDLENRIDPKVEERLLSEWLDFTNDRFSGDIFSPRRDAQAPPTVDWPDVRVNPALDDYDLMALQQFRTCSASLEAGDGSLLCVRCNYGTGILPSLFGVRMFVMDDALDTLPTNHPLNDIDKIRAVIDNGVPDLSNGLGAKVFEMGRRFTGILERYPRIGRYVHVYHPDLQGPIDVVELLWGSGFLLGLYETPDLVKALLELVTETYIAFMREWQKIVPPQNGWAVHWSVMHKGTVMLRNDSAMNISPEMFDEFAAPYDQRILDEFGGGANHFCGRGDHYIERMSETRGLYAINMSQPEYNDMESIFRNTVDKGIKLLGLPRPAAEEALRAGRRLHGNAHSG